MPAVRKICTYNLKNLFLCGEFEHEPKPKHELRPLLRMITQIDADVLVLQEVGSHASLSTLNAQLANPYPFEGFVAGNSRRSIHNAVLSREPFELVSHRELDVLDADGQVLKHYTSEAAAAAHELSPVGLQRDLQMIELGDLTLFSVHLKSQGNPPWQICPAHEVREAEARAIVEVIERYGRAVPSRPLVLLGDFNDRMDNDALAPFRALGWWDEIGEQLRSRNTGVQPSTYWPKRRSRIDHILLNAAAHRLLVVDSATIHRNQMARTASDHYAVSLQLRSA